MELCLGTVPSGIDYDLPNNKKVSRSEIFKILDYARAHGIRLLDTADAYDDSISITGKYMIQNPHSFEIISKLPMDLFKNLTSYRDYANAADLAAEDILRKLWIAHLNGILFQNPNYLYDKHAIAALRHLKQSGYTEWIGTTVYEPGSAFYALELGLDIIQLPVNLMDHRFDEFIEKTSTQTRIFARNIFHNGLLLMDSKEVQSRYPAKAQKIQNFEELCQDYGVARRDAAIAYLKKKSGISGIIFDLDRIELLKDNIHSFQKVLPEETVDVIAHQIDMVRNV